MSFKKNKIHLPKMELEVINSTKPVFNFTKGRDVGIHQTWKVEMDASAFGGATCPAPMTRAALLALRAAGTLDINCTYVITDHVQGRLVAGTTITMRADSPTELSENVTVNTTYDNEGWRGIYDIDRALVLELQDNRNNIARGINGTEVSNFDWGNTSYTNVVVDNATLTADIGNTASKQNIIIDKGAIVNLTSFAGSMSNITFSTAVSANFTGANGTWRLSTIRGGGTFNVSGYTGGGDNYYNEIDGANNINFSNSSSLVTLRQNEISGGSTITHSGVSTGTFNLSSSKVMSSVITHAVGAGNFSATSNNHFISGASISHTTGTMTLTNVHNYSSTIQQATNAGAIMVLNQAYLKQGVNVSNQSTGTLSMTQTTVENLGTIQRQAGATGTVTINYSQVRSSALVNHTATNTGNTTINYSELHGSSSVTNNGGATINITRGYVKGASNIVAQAGSLGTITITDVDMFSSSGITKLSTSTAGTLSVTATRLETSSFVQTSGTGNITVTISNLAGSSGVNVTGGNRNYTFTRLIQSGVSRVNLSGTGAAITDTHNEFELHYRGAYTNSCSGTANIINYCEISGLSGALTLSGTTGGSSFNRIKLYDGNVSKTNNPNAGTYQLWSISDAGVVTLTNHAANETINYLNVDAGSNFTINRTGLGTIQFVNVRNNGTANILGTSTTINKLDIEQGVVTMNAGSITNVSKKMNSTLTINAGAQSNVSHWNVTNKTATVANTNRIDYLGVVSSVPIV